MKKILVFIVVVFAFFVEMSAQEISPHTIGIRIGDSDGFNTEITYQRKLGYTNRLEADLGFNSSSYYNAWKLTGLYQWVWNIDKGFNWYLGAGAGIGSWHTKNNYKTDNNAMFVNATGDIGIEYNFEIPLLISLDFRPEIGLVNNFGNNDLGLDIALGLRYQF